MCGIAGILHLDGSQVDPVMVGHLNDALCHRGPDGQGVMTKGAVGLAQRRLAILDLTDAAAQPMESDDGSVAITFNGEMYNFAEEREELRKKGYEFRSTGDTEVLLKMYLEYGADCLGRMRGMFAFAIHDRKKNIVFLARDRIGKKPLKYFMSGRTFAFASELKALKTLKECPKGIDFEDVHHYLTMMYVPSPKTGFQGIRKLPAAHYMIVDLNKGSIDVRRYWSLSYNTDRSKSLEQWKHEILDTFKESVRLRMIADVPVGAFLSGGIDSAAVVAMMSELSDHPVETFSIGSPEETHNELPDAERIAKIFGTNHHPIVLKADILELLPEIVRTYEEPYADPSAIPTYLLTRATRQFVTVALNGDGGDENFAGYVRYPILQFSEMWRRLPVHALLKPFLRGLHNLRQDTFSYRVLRFEESVHLPWPERFLQYISFFTDEEKRALYAKSFADRQYPPTGRFYSAITADARSRGDNLLHRAMSMDLETYLADDLMPKVDLGAMAHGLEARSPFLDHKLLELTATLPAEYKLRGLNTKKWILKQILKDILPSETLAKKKSGFRLPLDRWFRSDLKPFVVDKLLARDSRLGDIFDRSAMEKFLRSYFASRIDYSDSIWALLYLDEWLREYA